jgi:hypothetical protein
MTEPIILDTPSKITRFHMLAQWHALKLEGLGIRQKGGSVLAHVKRTYGLKGSRETVAAQLRELIDSIA